MTLPPYASELVERALEAEEPVTDVNESDGSGNRRIYRAAQQDGDAVYLAQIQADDYDNRRVSFKRCIPSADVEVMQSWSGLATGRLSGPRNLGPWETLFTCFNAALREYYEAEDPDFRTREVA